MFALGITLSLVAWGYLVYAAIEFGGEARDGETQAWWWLGVAAVGAAACLFVALMLAARISRTLGITEPPEPKVQPPMPKAPPGPFEPSGRSEPSEGVRGSGPSSGGHRAVR